MGLRCRLCFSHAALILFVAILFVAQWYVSIIQIQNNAFSGTRERTVGDGGDDDADDNVDSGGDGGGGGTAFCIMIKDDNAILREWVAYHYHVFKMRRLIVAEDKDSTQSTWDVLDRFTRDGSGGRFHLNVTVWKNETYLPDWFRGEPIDYTRIALRMRVPGATTGAGADAIDRVANWTAERKEFMHKHNSYVARQNWMAYKCLKVVKAESDRGSGISWTAIVDTDEYLVPNPWVSGLVYEDAAVSNEEYVNATGLASILPELPTPNSLLSYLWGYLDQNRRLFESRGIPEDLSSKGCVLMPRIAFGGREDDETLIAESRFPDETTVKNETAVTSWNHKRFETLRWKYHQDLASRKTLPAANGMKGILNVDQHELSREEGFDPEHVPSIFPNIHRPSGRCHLQTGPNRWNVGNDNQHYQPIAIYHYMGSLERYLSRDDIRRTAETYRKKIKDADYAFGDTNHRPAADADADADPRGREERWWIKGWLDSFVSTHGSDAVYSIFGEGFARRSQSKTLHG